MSTTQGPGLQAGVKSASDEKGLSETLACGHSLCEGPSTGPLKRSHIPCVQGQVCDQPPLAGEDDGDLELQAAILASTQDTGCPELQAAILSSMQDTYRLPRGEDIT
eukprot:5563895-Amphidinium_carterae.1